MVESAALSKGKKNLSELLLFSQYESLQRNGKQKLMLPTTFRSYTQAGILTTKPPAKCCISNIYFHVNEAETPGLRVAAVMGA